MSINPKPEPADCVHLNYTRQSVIRDRYTAEPEPGFAVCIYTIGNDMPLYCQTFPSITGDLQMDYVTHVTRMARATTNPDEDHALRRMYPFFHAPDVLTMKCLIEEAANNWMDLCSKKPS